MPARKTGVVFKDKLKSAPKRRTPRTKSSVTREQIKASLSRRGDAKQPEAKKKPVTQEQIKASLSRRGDTKQPEAKKKPVRRGRFSDGLLGKTKKVMDSTAEKKKPVRRSRGGLPGIMGKRVKPKTPRPTGGPRRNLGRRR